MREEGGGLLYHRPTNPNREDGDKKWELGGAAPRRYVPSSLPPGLVQLVGRSGHKKLREVLGAWVEPDALAVERGGLRTLTVAGPKVRYRMGIHPPVDSGATMYFVDGEMNSVDEAAYPLMPLDQLMP